MIPSVIRRLPVTLWRALTSIDCIAAKELCTVEKEYPQVESYNETIDKLISGASISRFGDGEFGVCIGRTVNYTGTYNLKLQQRILDVLHTPQTEKFLIGIPQLIVQKQKKKLPRWTRTKMFVRQHLLFQTAADDSVRRWTFYESFVIRTWRFLKKHIREKRYANSFISRPEVFAAVPLEKWKLVWNDRNVVFIVPMNGRFTNDERIFGNIKSAQFIYVNPVDAFADYDNILRLACDLAQNIENPLLLIAAGQTAAVLACDLHKQGYQAIDIGHLPNSYSAYLGEIKTPEDLPKVRQ